MSFIKDVFSGGVEGLFGGVAQIIGKVKADPTKVMELEAEILKVKAELEGRIIVADSEARAAVNRAIEAEAKSEHWLVWTWRPTVGLTFAGTIINNYILFPYFANMGMQRVDIPETVWVAMLTVLGAAAYTRGQEKIERLKNSSRE